MENFFYILCCVENVSILRYGQNVYILRYGEKFSILCYWEKFKDTKWVIRSRKSQNDRQSNGQNERDKKTNNDIQNPTH